MVRGLTGAAAAVCLCAYESVLRELKSADILLFMRISDIVMVVAM